MDRNQLVTADEKKDADNAAQQPNEHERLVTILKL